MAWIASLSTSVLSGSQKKRRPSRERTSSRERTLSRDKPIVPVLIGSTNEEEPGRGQVAKQDTARPTCKYGADCRRSSLKHFQDFAHPEGVGPPGTASSAVPTGTIRTQPPVASSSSAAAGPPPTYSIPLSEDNNMLMQDNNLIQALLPSLKSLPPTDTLPRDGPPGQSKGSQGSKTSFMSSLRSAFASVMQSATSPPARPPELQAMGSAGKAPPLPSGTLTKETLPTGTMPPSQFAPPSAPPSQNGTTPQSAPPSQNGIAPPTGTLPNGTLPPATSNASGFDPVRKTLAPPPKQVTFKLNSERDCKFGCGRRIGYDGGQPYDACCKACALCKGSGTHDANCSSNTAAVVPAGPAATNGGTGSAVAPAVGSTSSRNGGTGSAVAPAVGSTSRDDGGAAQQCTDAEVATIMNVDHALELRQQARSFSAGGDKTMAEVMLAHSIDKLEAACAALPPGAKLQEQSTAVLAAWRRSENGAATAEEESLESEIDEKLDDIVMGVESALRESDAQQQGRCSTELGPEAALYMLGLSNKWPTNLTIREIRRRYVREATRGSKASSSDASGLQDLCDAYSTLEFYMAVAEQEKRAKPA